MVQVDTFHSGELLDVQHILAVYSPGIWNEGRVQHPSLQALKVHVPEEGVPLDLGSPLLLAAQPLLRVFGEQL